MTATKSFASYAYRGAVQRVVCSLPSLLFLFRAISFDAFGSWSSKKRRTGLGHSPKATKVSSSITSLLSTSSAQVLSQAKSLCQHLLLKKLQLGCAAWPQLPGVSPLLLLSLAGCPGEKQAPEASQCSSNL